MPAFVATITVTLKPGVLDPQGQAIENALGGLGFDGVGTVRQGKVFSVALDAKNKAAATEACNAMCEKLLANTVIETYAVDLAAAAK